MSSVNEKQYVIVTPARNEEAHLEKTIESVVTQTILPQKWVIVSDGSVDRTDEIAVEYARRHPFIEFLRVGEPNRIGKKDFGAKVRAFRAGYERLNATPYHYVGNLDADITFAPGYFAEILRRFEENPRLGVAGGIVWEPTQTGFAPQRTSLNSVCGSVQLFRRVCYENFGGYIPMEMGGVDAAAEIQARMHGWQVQTFPDVPVYATRRVLTGGATVLHTRYRQGVSNYLLGYHPLFQMAASLQRIAQYPFVVGSVATLMGYGVSWVRGRRRSLPSEAIRFLRSEQMSRLGMSLRPWKVAAK